MVHPITRNSVLLPSGGAMLRLAFYSLLLLIDWPTAARCWSYSHLPIKQHIHPHHRQVLLPVFPYHRLSFSAVAAAKGYGGGNDDDDDENDRWDTEKADPVASTEALDLLVPRSEIRSWNRPTSNRQGFAQVAWHFGWLAVMAVAFNKPWPILSTLGMAWVSAFYFCGLHETVHRTAFRSRFWNDAWAQVFGMWTFRPARHYWYYHWQHHRYTGNPALDSELQPGSWLDMDIRTPFGYLLYLSGIPFWMDAIGNNLIRHARGKCSDEIYLVSNNKESSSSSAAAAAAAAAMTTAPTKTQTQKKKNKAQTEVIWEARVYLLIYGMLAAAATWSTSIRSNLLRYWLVPAILGQPILRGYLLGEHHGRRQSPIIYENTRTMQTNGWIRRLAWNMPYHLEHHAWPAVPFWKLPQLHSLLQDRVLVQQQQSRNSEDIDTSVESAESSSLSHHDDKRRGGAEEGTTTTTTNSELWWWWDQGEVPPPILRSTRTMKSEPRLSGRDGYLILNWKYFRSLVTT